MSDPGRVLRPDPGIPDVRKPPPPRPNNPHPLNPSWKPSRGDLRRAWRTFKRETKQRLAQEAEERRELIAAYEAALRRSAPGGQQ